MTTFFHMAALIAPYIFGGLTIAVLLDAWFKADES